MWLGACLRLQLCRVHLKGQPHAEVKGGHLAGEARGALHLHLGAKLPAEKGTVDGVGVRRGG